MTLKDQNVVTASVGYVFTGAVGLPLPTPDEIEAFDPTRFGCASFAVEVTATTGTVEYTVGTETTTVPFDATAAQIQTALNELDGVGEGGVEVEAGTGAGEFTVWFTGPLQGVNPGLTVTGADAIPASVLNGWSQIGHTSRNDMPEFGVDGGDSEIKGTWQNVALKQVTTEVASDFVTFQIVQLDRNSFTLHYGPEAGPKVPGIFRYSGNPVANERAMLVVIVDGDVTLGFAAKKASFKREDSIAMPVDDFMQLPVRATFLKHGSNDLFQWISKDLFD